MAIDALALPEGYKVSSGNVRVDQNDDCAIVQQSSAQAILDWHAFNIDLVPGVDFRQSFVQVTILNRIHDQQLS